MKHRKFKADNIFTGHEMLPAGYVLVTDEQGVVADIVPETDAGGDVTKLEGLLTPGFVNTHCHLELSHMKAVIGPGGGLVDFLTRVIRQRSASPASVQQAMALAHDELYEGGTVAVADICNTADSAAIKAASNMKWRSFIEVTGFTEETAQARIDFARNVQKQFTTPATLAPHAPYSVSAALFRLINEASAGEVITVHNQETAAENELYQYKTGDFLALYKNLSIDPAPFRASGKTSLQTYLPWLGKASGLLLVHNTSIQEADILFAKEFAGSAIGLFFCICINANLYITSKLPPLDILRKHNCLITIGTDSYASNHQLSMMEELKTIHREFPRIPLTDTLQWATLNGARALQIDNMLGSFEKNKQPGIVLISGLHEQQLTPASKAVKVL